MSNEGGRLCCRDDGGPERRLDLVALGFVGKGLSGLNFGAGDEARTRNFQLGNLNFRSFIFNTYKTAQKKCTCMRCILCMHCLICVSLRDVCGTVCQAR
jgi:hypothetical protein